VKIAFFNDTYHPYVSGVISSVDRFTMALRERGHEVELYVPGNWTSPWKETVGDDVHEVPSFPVPGFEGLRIGTPLLADGHLSVSSGVDDEMDVVHAHSPFVIGRIGARLSEKRHLPFIFTCHSIYPRYSEYVPLVSDLAADVIREYVTEFCTWCDVVLAPSRYVKRVLRMWGVTSRIEILPSGVDVDQVGRVKQAEVLDASETRRRLLSSIGVDVEEKVLLSVGRIDPQKNLEFLLDVLQHLLEDLPVHLVVIGDGPGREKLVNSAEDRGLAGRVHFLGKKSFSEVVKWYCTADAFCFSSTTETQGLVVVEAMAADLPVVALSSASSRELIDDGVNGLLTRQCPGEFARAVRRVLTDRELVRRLAAGGTECAERYSIDVLTDRLTDIYRSAIDRKRRSLAH